MVGRTWSRFAWNRPPSDKPSLSWHRRFHLPCLWKSLQLGVSCAQRRTTGYLEPAFHEGFGQSRFVAEPCSYQLWSSSRLLALCFWKGLLPIPSSSWMYSCRPSRTAISYRLGLLTPSNWPGCHLQPELAAFGGKSLCWGFHDVGSHGAWLTRGSHLNMRFWEREGR